MEPTGRTSCSMVSNWLVPERMIPAAKAPMMRADPARDARAARPSANATEKTSSTLRIRIRTTTSNSRGMTKRPISTAATRNPTATARRPDDPQHRHRGAGRETRDHAQDDEAEHVIDDRGADDDPGLRRRHAAQIGQHARGDADRSRREGRADEDAGGRQVGGGNRRMREERPVDVAQGERQHHADGRDGERGGADAEHLLEIGLQPDLEEQEENAELGEDVHELAPGPSVGTTPSTLPPSSTPATSSPSTAGCPMRSAAPPRTLAVTSMVARTRKKRAMSTPPSAARRGTAASRRSGALQRRLRARAQHERVMEERQFDTLFVLGLDDDPDGAPPRTTLNSGACPRIESAVHSRRRSMTSSCTEGAMLAWNRMASRRR